MGLIGLVVLAVGETATPMILEWTRTPPAVLPQATVYMRIFLLSLPLGMTMMLLRNMLQGVGDSRTFLHYQAGSLLLTAALDPVLMLGWPRLGLPAFGLNGTAYATIVSQLLTVAALVAHLRRQRNLVAPSLRLGDFDAPPPRRPPGSRCR